MTAEVSTVAWLLEPDGTETVSALNVLSRDDLDRRYFDK
jgi:hypothetical protein